MFGTFSICHMLVLGMRHCLGETDKLIFSHFLYFDCEVATHDFYWKLIT